MEGGPYREPKALTELIPPDRRRQRAIVVVVASMVAGAVVFEVGKHMCDADASSSVEIMPAVVPIPPPEPSSLPSPRGPLTADDVERVVAAHRVALKDACWTHRTDVGAATNLTLRLVVGASGDVVSAEAQGGDALVGSCVEAQARTWQFPARGERSEPIRIPFAFLRE